MDIDHAVIAFSALSQETRLRVFKLLIEYGKESTAAGTLSEELKIPHNTLSFHLSHLSHAGLITSKRQERSIIYTANTDAMEKLIGYLNENCCIRETVTVECCPPPKKGKQK